MVESIDSKEVGEFKDLPAGDIGGKTEFKFNFRIFGIGDVLLHFRNRHAGFVEDQRVVFAAAGGEVVVYEAVEALGQGRIPL